MADLAAIGIMCKAPRSGRVKTWLAAMIGAEQATTLSACFLRDVAAAIEAVSAAKGYGVYAPAGTEAELRSILPSYFGLLLQADADFGLVLLGGVRDLLAAGHDCVALVNSDSPTLPPSLLSATVEALRKPGNRVVLGPTIDGGYYLIGLKAPHQRLFMNIPWGTADVARLTLERAAEIGLETALLPEWYDVDDVETLGMLRDEIAGRPIRVTRNGLSGGAAATTRAYLNSNSMAASIAANCAP